MVHSEVETVVFSRLDQQSHLGNDNVGLKDVGSHGEVRLLCSPEKKQNKTKLRFLVAIFLGRIVSIA